MHMAYTLGWSRWVRRAQISRDVILEASLAIADADGLAAVTMQAVARALAVTPMALYRHLDGKADLLDGLVESLLTQFELPASELPWEERLRALARSTRALAQQPPECLSPAAHQTGGDARLAEGSRGCARRPRGCGIRRRAGSPQRAPAQYGDPRLRRKRGGAAGSASTPAPRSTPTSPASSARSPS